MLTHLRIEHFGILSKIELDFQSGFTIFSGETGAGKSMIIDAIGLLLGQSANDTMIQTHHDYAVIEAQFNLATLPNTFADFVEPGEPIILFRKISKKKDHQIRLNSQTITLKTLKTLTPHLISIIGQHEHMHLLSEDRQRQWLDSADPAALREAKTTYTNAYQTWKEIEKKRLTLKKMEENEAQNIAFLEFQCQDIASQNFQKEEDITLEDHKKNLKNKTKNLQLLKTLAHTLQTAQNNLENIQKTQSLLENTPEQTDWQSHYDLALNALNQHLQAVETQLFQINAFSDSDIDAIESRLDVIFKYKTKYQMPSIDALRDYHQSLEEKLHLLNNLSKENESLDAHYEKALTQTKDAGALLSKERNQLAQKISKSLTQTLEDLNFVKPKFEIKLSPLDYPTESGIDAISFLLSPHPGTPLAPLSQIASGGELSRIMLALKTIFSKANPVPTLIFDEVDTGVGGLTANKIGDFIHQISKETQVFCITHLPQIARVADHHLVITKVTTHDQTETQVKTLTKDQHKEELHRMVGGEKVLKSLSLKKNLL